MKRYKLTDDDRAHAKIVGAGHLYGAETRIPLADGRELRCPPYPEPCDYIRIVFDGQELAYWNADEIREDVEDVLGALMGILRSAQGEL